MPKSTSLRTSPVQSRSVPLETRVIQGCLPEPATPRRIAADFRALVAGGLKLKPAGQARPTLAALERRGDVPRHRVRLFDHDLYLTDFRHDHWLNFLVAFVVPSGAGRSRSCWPRIFYKDASLVWRVASHFISTEQEHWIGKGAVRWEKRKDGEYLTTAEETTDLPYELQYALDEISRRRKSQRDDDAVHLYLRRGGSHRTEPFADFTRPRDRDAELYRVNRGRSIARFARKGDPTSLVFTKGYEPDFSRGVVESTPSGSRLYGGPVEKVRILSRNREIQFQFVASPTHAFVNHPQTLTTALSTYGVRTVDVLGDEHAFLPGFEYHFLDDSLDPPEIYSQIPQGWAGDAGTHDSERADASPWIEQMPIIRQFRRKYLGESGV